jgi:hypothetical protein
MISAPRSPSICVQEGPASTRLRSRTVMPSSGPGVIESCPRSWPSDCHCIGWSLIRKPAQELFSNLLADAPEHGKPRFFRASSTRRIVEAPVKPLRRARKHRACLIGGVAHRDDPVPSIMEEPLQGLRLLGVRSIPTSAIARIARGCTCVASVPALAASYRPPASARSKDSAIWLRAEL